MFSSKSYDFVSQVLRNCVRWIFDNKTADARKLCPAVARALKGKAARLALCEELAAHVSGAKVELDHQQFEMVTHLMNCALWVRLMNFLCK